MNIKKAMNDFSVDLQIISDFMAFIIFQIIDSKSAYP